MSKGTGRWILALALALAGVCGLMAQDKPVLRLGLVAELTGDIPAVGASCQNAARMAVDEINAAGGVTVAGRAYALELIVEDNGGKADQSVSAAQKLISMNRVLALIGPNASRYAIPVSEIAESSRTPMITPWATSPKATINARTGQSKKYVFRACFEDSFQGQAMARFVFETLKARKAAVLYDVASEYNKGIAEYFKLSYEKMGGTVCAFETYTTGDKDFSAQMTKIRESAPEVIFLPNYYSEVPLQIQQARRLGITAPFVGSDSWGSEELIKLAGADCEGCYFSTHYAPDRSSPEASRFIAAYRTRYGQTPDDVAALTYDAFGILRGALEKASAPEREPLREALAGLARYEGVTGSLRYAPGSGNPVKSAVVLKIEKGRFVWAADVPA